MRLRRRLRDHVHDLALAVDDEGRALDAHVLLAVHRLLDPHAVLLEHFVARVADQVELQLVLLVELLQLRRLVRRNSNDDRAGLVVFLLAIADAAGLRRAARRVGLRASAHCAAQFQPRSSITVTSPRSLSAITTAERLCRQLGDDVARRVVVDGVHRVQAQRVDAKLVAEHARVLASTWARTGSQRKIDGRAPRRVVPLGEVGTKFGEIISFGPEVVVDHVGDHAQRQAVRGVDQSAQALRPAVARLRRDTRQRRRSPSCDARERRPPASARRR